MCIIILKPWLVSSHAFLLALISDFRCNEMNPFVKLLVVSWALVSLEEAASHGVQPLSLIAIEKAAVALDKNAYVKASPSILGLNVSQSGSYVFMLYAALAEKWMIS